MSMPAWHPGLHLGRHRLARGAELHLGAQPSIFRKKAGSQTSRLGKNSSRWTSFFFLFRGGGKGGGVRGGGGGGGGLIKNRGGGVSEEEAREGERAPGKCLWRGGGA